jgi:hypothetical protein
MNSTIMSSTYPSIITKLIQKRAARLLELFQGFTLNHREPIHDLQCMERVTPLYDYSLLHLTATVSGDLVVILRALSAPKRALCVPGGP